jgi:hypothetical protein
MLSSEVLPSQALRPADGAEDRRYRTLNGFCQLQTICLVRQMHDSIGRAISISANSPGCLAPKGSFTTVQLEDALSFVA